MAAILSVMFLRLKFKKDRPTSLNLRKTRSSPTKNIDINNEEELNIYFKFRGQMRDAYEIIGVPAGSSMNEVERAYNRKSSQDNPSRELLDMAYKAIEQKLFHKKKS